jgi:phytoene dehydrogenase-like protein
VVSRWIEVVVSDYDAIVIGAGIGGLGVSAFLAQAGRRVLTLEKNKAIGGRAYSFQYKGHTLNIGGPRAGLEGGKVDALFAKLGVLPGERGFFDGYLHYRDGEFMPLVDLASRAPSEEAARFAVAMNEVAEDELHEYDGISAADWLASKEVKAPELLDLTRYGAVAMCTLPRLEEMAASTVMEAMRIVQKLPRVYLCTKGYGDFMRILAETSIEHGGEVRTRARATEILIENGRVRGAIVEQEGGHIERIEAPLVVTAFPIWDLFDLTDEAVFPPDFALQVKHLEKTTAVFGVIAALREPLYEGKHFLLTDARRAGYPLAGYMATNVSPRVSPEGEHLFEVSCICDSELGQDRERLNEKIDLMKAELDEMFPGWEEKVIWEKPYFHWVESARTPGREGIHRPGPKPPAVEGLYFTGDTVTSRALPGLETAADSAVICANQILTDTGEGL